MTARGSLFLLLCVFATEVVTQRRVWQFLADTEDERQAWVRLISHP